MKAPTFDEVVRAIVLVIALLSVVGLAFMFHSEAMGGALIGMVGLGGSYLYRGRVQSQTPAPKAGD